MVDLSSAITQMAILLLVTIIGFAAAKRGYLDEHVKGKLTLLLLNVTLPCMILASAGSIDASQMGGQIGWTFVLGIAQFFLLLASGALCNLVLRTPRGERPLYLFMSVLTNTGFVGIPVIAALYGDQTVLLSSVFIMAMNLLIYSVGFASSPRAERRPGNRRGRRWRIPPPWPRSAPSACCLRACGCLPSSRGRSTWWAASPPPWPCCSWA
ncbi:AEC family transporter [Eggerthella sinensis]|uniref:AEC family transporter n=1 Tax=Eggerthella sinensis TaxID=242230 RepID=UPI0022E7E387|nr:AEC family transporter [Eggerthella sinensis]